MKGKPYNALRKDRRDDYANYSLRAARLKAGYTLNSLAREVGVTTSAIGAYERLRIFPSTVVAERISRILGRRTGDLFPEYLREKVSEKKEELRRKRQERNIPYETNPLEEISENQLPITGGDVVLEEVSYKELKDRIREVMNCTLPIRWRKILGLRLGLDGEESYSLKEVGRIFGISGERVRQLEKKAIARIKDSPRSRKLEEFL
jgi:RNA polymerase sigma factor (sigma-70 family)